MINNKYNIIIVTPVYEDRQACGLLCREIAALYGRDIFLVVVDDGSIKQPVERNVLEDAGLDGVVLKLCRNVGHQAAIAVGLDFVAEYMNKSQRVVVMDSDGEDKPASISELIKCLEDDQIDAVVAKRKSRVETIRFKIFYSFYKTLFSLLTGRKINFGNFMTFKYHALQRLVTMQGLTVHVAATMLASRLRIKECGINRGVRYAGQSKMNFVSLVLHGFRGLMIFAEDVLVRVGIACIVIAVLSLVGIILAVILKLFGFATPGWFSIALGILVLIFLQTGTITLVILMLTGVMRKVPELKAINHTHYVSQLLKTAISVTNADIK